MPGFVLLVRPRDDGDPSIRLGITVTRKIGGAVVRNRMKRRLRNIARELLPAKGLAGADHVLIGRQAGIERDFALLKGEMELALAKLAKRSVRPDPGEGPSSASSSNAKQGKASTGSARTDGG
jgi:ribonuclease P protein component